MTAEGALQQGFSERKVSGGKLVRLRLIHDGQNIRSVRITGDFLLHPEEAIEEIEMSLCGLPVGSRRDAYLDVIHAIEKQERAEFIGFSPEDIADLIIEALT